MRKVNIYFFVCLATLGCSEKTVFQQLSHSISSSFQKPKIQNMYHKERLFLYNNHYLDFLNYQNDTIFIIQGNGLPHSTFFYSSIWNTNGTVTLHNGNGKYLLDSPKVEYKHAYPKEFRDDLREWDTVKLKRLSSLAIHGVHQYAPDFVSRIVIHNGNPEVQSIRIYYYIDKDPRFIEW